MDELYLFKSQDEGNRLLYAYYKGEFWFYDPNVQQWYISGHVREQYELEAQTDISLTPDDFICTGYGYELVAEYEVPVAALDALWAAKKVLPPEPASVEMPLPKPGDMYRSPKSGQLYKIGELTNGKKTCYLTMRSNAQGGTWVPVNSSVYPKLSDAQGEFEAWIRTEQLEPVAPTGDAAATTAASAVPMPSTAAGTSTTSESGEDADTSMSLESGTSGPSTSPARGCPAADGDAESEAIPAAAPATSPASLPAFDFGALDADTAEKLRGITDCVMELYQSYAWGMAYQVGRAHDLLCGDSDRCETVSQRSENGQFAKKEKTFTAWCAYIGVERRSAYNLLNAYRLICKATPEQQKNLQLAPAKLLYETGKKDVPNHLVNAVLDGDITKTKQFLDAKREWQAKLDAERAAREKAEQERDEAATHIQAARDMQIDTARERDTALRRATEAENRAAGAQKLADQRGAENTDLRRKLKEAESRPIDIAVAEPSEADKERWRKEGEDRMAATLQDTVLKAHKAKITAENQVADLQDENERLRIALDRRGQLDASAAMACSSCAAALSAWFESCARDTAADLTPALARMRRLRLALDTAIEYGTWPDDAALDDLEVSEDAGC